MVQYILSLPTSEGILVMHCSTESLMEALERAKTRFEETLCEEVNLFDIKWEVVD
jgi:hypothetical protein